MTLPALPPGPPVNPNDSCGNQINRGDVIVYGVGRGAIDFGIIEDIIFKPGEKRVYDRNTNTSTLEPYWNFSIKVQKMAEKWSKTKFVRLQYSNHTLVLEGATADNVRKSILDSWLDPDAKT